MNLHNGWFPRNMWLEDREREAIVRFRGVPERGLPGAQGNRIVQAMDTEKPRQWEGLRSTAKSS